MKFEMPVVILSEMKMNESIAADCCYSVYTSGLVTTKNVLNGGTIGDYVTYPLKEEVRGAYGTYANLPAYHYYAYTVNPDADAPTITDAGVVNAGNYFIRHKVLFAEFTAGENVSTVDKFTCLDSSCSGTLGLALDKGEYIERAGGACDHANANCWFVEKKTVSGAHIGATVRHIFGGSEWSTPHVAQQYNS